MRKRLAIVILNWNGKHLLEKFLPILLAHTPADAEVVVADNASTDSSIEFLQQHYPQLRTICNDQNYGFAKGYNLALSQVDADNYCLLNSDIEVTAGWVEPILHLLDTQSDVAAVQPKVLSYTDRNRFEYAGAAGGFLDRYGYPFCRGRVFETIEQDEQQYDTVADIFWATGAALFVRSNVYWEVGGLDDDFFAHMEEIDLCWRMKNRGYRIVAEPHSTIYHVGGGTLNKENPFKTYLNFRNNHYLLLKNLPKVRLLPTFLVRCVLDNVAALHFLLQGHPHDFCAVYRAHFAVLKTFRKMLQKRKDQPLSAYVSLCQESCLVAYHLKHKRYFNGSFFVKK